MSPFVRKKRRMNMKIQLKISYQVILCLLFQQALQVVDEASTPKSQKTFSVAEVDLMFEILLEGIEMDPDDNIVLLDKELASMRIGRNFLSLINDNIPKSQSSMMQIVTTLQNQRSRLTPVQFDNLVLSMVYSAKQGWHQKRQEDQEAWGRALLQLANITVHELRESYLFNYT